MSTLRVHGYKTSLDLRSIQQIAIRREGSQAVVEIVMQNEKSPRRYTLDSYEDGIKFYKTVWEWRQQTLDCQSRTSSADAPSAFLTPSSFQATVSVDRKP
jgi:hypothetical protein